MNYFANVTKMADFVKLRNMENFGEKFRKLRKAKGVSGWKIEQDTGIPRTTISNIETGRRPPSEEALRKLAAMPELGANFETLMAWKRFDEVAPDERHAVLAEFLGVLPVEDTIDLMVEIFGIEKVRELVHGAMERQGMREPDA